MIEYPETPGWKFFAEEVSAGVYEVKGKDSEGRSVTRKGSDVNALLLDCRNDALEMMRSK